MENPNCLYFSHIQDSDFCFNYFPANIPHFPILTNQIRDTESRVSGDPLLVPLPLNIFSSVLNILARLAPRILDDVTGPKFPKNL